MLKWPRALLFGMGLAFVSSTFAAEVRIGFVEPDRILRESAPGLRAGKKLDKEFDVRKVEVQRLATQGKALQQLMDKGAIAEVDRRVKERELIKMNQDYQRMTRELNEDMNTRRNEEYSGLQERVRTAIEQIAKNEKYDLIVQDAAWFNPKIDITDKVIKLLADK
ncbi:OmpH family outer membrane protein [Iodobacter sp. CM08]|uniref:OmpH family outer membrane protein n=1 Tax=Iodobacter sp. CM08 TaxID=3085902 RepID=UPI002982A648|nr:OmpH family outer membrane protein [Iodobacter sp. CM08]MDW5417123.1 OmpH family outer membrane protein [Iodobacter sp. CM08]